jgi:hypothetical protein
MSWAIALYSERPRRHFLGRFWVNFDVPVHYTGYTTAVWHTRQEARKALWSLQVKQAYPKAKVTKVTVEVREVSCQ